MMAQHDDTSWDQNRAAVSEMQEQAPIQRRGLGVHRMHLRLEAPRSGLSAAGVEREIGGEAEGALLVRRTIGRAHPHTGR